MRWLCAAAVLIAVPTVPVAAQAPVAPRTTPIPAPAEPDAIPLDTGGVPGGARSETWFSYVAGRPVELHVYQSGGHGYGLGRPGTATAGWIEEFHRWLGFIGILNGKAP